MITIYGIKNCDTMKKAFAWLDGRKLAYEFHDYKKAGIDRARLTAWCGKVGWEALVNKRGTTWRKLSDAEKAAAGDEAGAIALMISQPSVIKRPVLERDGRYHLGFAEDQYEALFGA